MADNFVIAFLLFTPFYKLRLFFVSNNKEKKRYNACKQIIQVYIQSLPVVRLIWNLVHASANNIGNKNVYLFAMFFPLLCSNSQRDSVNNFNVNAYRQVFFFNLTRSLLAGFQKLNCY